MSVEFGSLFAVSTGMEDFMLPMRDYGMMAGGGDDDNDSVTCIIDDDYTGESREVDS